MRTRLTAMKVAALLIPVLATLLAVMIATAAVPAAAQDAPTGAKAEWLASRDACSASNRAACDRAVELAAQLFERTDRDLACITVRDHFGDGFMESHLKTFNTLML